MKKKYCTLIALAASISLVIVGLLQEQNISVLTKAINICLECIGIG